MRKGQFVAYKAGRGMVEAIVRTVHRGGEVTIEARHHLRAGKPYGCYLGYRFRIGRPEMRANLRAA